MARAWPRPPNTTKHGLCACQGLSTLDTIGAEAAAGYTLNKVLSGSRSYNRKGRVDTDV